MPCTNKVKPLLVAASISEIAKTIDVSFPYAAARCEQVPRRLWLKL